MLNLIGLDLEELKSEIVKIGEAPFRAAQIWDWIYVKNSRDFDQFSNLPQSLKDKLKAHYSIAAPKIVKDLISKDGTRKWLIKFADGQEVEMVFIPEGEDANSPDWAEENNEDKLHYVKRNQGKSEIDLSPKIKATAPIRKRGTLCISSQVGCTLTCKFCHTGTQKLVRNLKAGEIVWQFLVARDLLKDPKSLTNIVFMGMGEPLFNFENVKKAINIFHHKKGINFSKRRVTLSTSGVVPEMIKFCDEVNSGLAVSLHGASDELRGQIMPINNKYPLAELMKACQYYNQVNSQKITFEYVMLKDVNDSNKDARALVHLIKSHKLLAKVNLIPFNAWEGAIYQCSSKNRIHEFAKILKDNDISAPIRKTRGEDVMAACGQLKSLSKSEKLIRD